MAVSASMVQAPRCSTREECAFLRWWNQRLAVLPTALRFRLR